MPPAKKGKPQQRQWLVRAATSFFLNLVPLLGFIFMGWPVMKIIYYYFLEALVFGIYLSGQVMVNQRPESKLIRKIPMAAGLVVVFFFVMFCQLLLAIAFLPGLEGKQAADIFFKGVWVSLGVLTLSYTISFWRYAVGNGPRDDKLNEIPLRALPKGFVIICTLAVGILLTRELSENPSPLWALAFFIARGSGDFLTTIVK